jgi:Cys-rich protein (TIGR01571 family)
MSGQDQDHGKRDSGDHRPREWGHKLFGCMEDPCLCLATTWLPCYTFALNSLMLGQGCLICGWAFTVPVLGCVVHFKSRKLIKERRHIGGGGDLIPILCCPFCALCQEASELRDMVREEVEREALRKAQQPVTQVVIVQQPGQQLPPGQVYVVQGTPGPAQAQPVVVVQQPPAPAMPMPQPPYPTEEKH